MKAKWMGLVSLSILFAAPPALAETAAGRITSISEDGRQLTLNRQDMYNVRCDCLRRFRIGDDVQVFWDETEQGKIVKRVDQWPH